MGLKHSKRTRAQKLQNRAHPVTGFDGSKAPIVSAASRSKYKPHTGKKEQERAARSYMQHYFPIYGSVQTDPLHLRAAPIAQVISKRRFYEQPF